MNKVRIVCISDTHTKHDTINLPSGDILLCSGDISYTGKFEEIASFANWFGKQKHKTKICIFGNHELTADPSSSLRNIMINLIKENGIIYLDDSSCEIEGLKIFGSAYSLRFFDWAFQLDPGEPARKKWSDIPNDTQILITHSPPYGLMDNTSRGDLIGCPELRKRVEELPNLKLHLYGHNHNGHGRMVRYFNNRRVELVNAAIMTEQYQPINKPIVVDLEY